MRAAVDVAVDPLVEVDQRPLVAAVADVVELLEQRRRSRAVGVRRPLGGEPRREALEREPHLRQAREVATSTGETKMPRRG